MPPRRRPSHPALDAHARHGRLAAFLRASASAVAEAGGDPAVLHAVLIKTASSSRTAYNLLFSRYHPSLSLHLLSRLPFHFRPTAASLTSSLSSLSASSPASVLPLLRRVLGMSPALLADGPLSSLLRSMPPSIAPHVHALAFKLALSSSPYSASCLITLTRIRPLTASARSPASARHLFDEIPVANRDPVCYSSTIVGLAQNGWYEESLSVFAGMRVNAVDSTMYALSGALRAAAGLAVLEQTCGIHAHAVVVGLDGNVCVGTALVDAYGKAGGVDDAARVFKGLGADRNLITWNTVLSAHAQQGDVQAVIGLFNQMMELGFAPDGLTFLAVLTACSNAGAATEAEFWLETMQSKYSVKPGLEHYTCVVGAMARMGRLEDAESVACTMPCKPDAAVWRTLLMGCVVHRKVDLAESMGQRLLEINPKDDSAYVLLANVYSAAGKKNEEAEAWTAMRDHGVRKEGGRSWIEVRGLVHVFVANERRHEQLLEIYDKLTELILEVEKLGYKETDEGFGHHSERLALAYGLISGAAPSGKVLRIVKNLRICAHCHEFFKYASMVIDRVIVVRDVNRYHTIKKGDCSCRDCW
ncbi:LOW QUALITY PROTEIN: pentatricopeptide repeat-containing protein At2g03880, mitochondrial [Zea mays]|nr:LOW QUALITY PROTEIN: pentatricopeptide repeat-containing protein At2g03880, mitochondrial [Zea mays]|eukprot:XP_020401127.1 LOW QUALITY PROTEIN: pentatricopeptide repeat-containing protein At2g03880, mitochondrial [Zea mays]